MQKIDKSKILSTVYKKWEEQLEKDKKSHPKYEKTKRFYDDVVMNLFFCQKGLCAYTEQLLCAEEYYHPKKWKNGRYQGKKAGIAKGNLEHFDETLKSKKSDLEGRKDWLWDNFFMVDTDVNVLKGTKKVDTILKPDEPHYNEEELLEYNLQAHIFIAKTTLSQEKQDRINKMIREILHINHSTIRKKRESVIKNGLDGIEWGMYDKNYMPNEFPTAFKMAKKSKVKT